MQFKGEIKKLIILESRVECLSTPNLASFGHVLLNDKESGESLVRCGAGVLALKRCRFSDQEESFKPGNQWKSIRLRLGVRIEDWLWELSTKK